MSFPILSVPTFDITVPSTNRSIKCRPFLVKEQKILLMYVQTEDENELINLIKQLLQNCIVDLNGHQIENFAIFDLEYIFLKIRSKSKGEKITLNFDGLENSSCEECKKPKQIEINLNDIRVKSAENFSNKIQLTDDISISMNYPKISIIDKMNSKKEDINVVFKLIRSCINCVYDKEGNVYSINDITDEEYTHFIEHLTDEQFEKITNFFAQMPTLECEVDLSCSKCGKKDIQIIKGVRSFFQ